MARTDHPRRRYLKGHRTAVRHVRCYDGYTRHQSVCSCGLSGPLATFWHVANEDGRDHVDEVRRRERAALEAEWGATHG